MSLTIETERSLSIVTRDEMEVPIETDRNFTVLSKKERDGAYERKNLSKGDRISPSPSLRFRWLSHEVKLAESYHSFRQHCTMEEGIDTFSV